MSSPNPGTPQRRRRLIIGGALAVLLVLGVVLGLVLNRRSTATGENAPTTRLTVALPTAYPTEAPPSVPIPSTPEPAITATATPRITAPSDMTARTLPDFTATTPQTDAGAVSNGAVAAQQNTYTWRGEEILVKSSQWPTEAIAKREAEALRKAAPGKLIVSRTFSGGQGTYWYYELDGKATQVYQVGNVAGTFSGTPQATQQLAVRLLR